MPPDEKEAALKPYIGRLCIYLESRVFSIARVAEVRGTDEGMEAVLEAVTELPLICYYGETPPRFAEEDHPIGNRWEVSRRWEWFYLDEDHWDASPYLGFHMFFAPDVVERFLRRDLTWTDDYF